MSTSTRADSWVGERTEWSRREPQAESETRAGFDVDPPSKTPRGAAAPKGRQESEKDSPDPAGRVFKRLERVEKGRF